MDNSLISLESDVASLKKRDFYSHAPAKCWNCADAQGAASTARIAQMINTYETMIIT